MYVLFMLGFMYIYIPSMNYRTQCVQHQNPMQSRETDQKKILSTVKFLFFFVGTISKQLIQLSNELSSLQAVVLTLE